MPLLFSLVIPNSIPKASQESLEGSHEVQLEDVKLCEAVQRGLRSPAYDTGRSAKPCHTWPNFHAVSDHLRYIGIFNWADQSNLCITQLQSGRLGAMV